MQRAMALEAKYAVMNGKEPQIIWVTPTMAGTHWRNRSGSYPQGLACKTLLKNIHTDGIVKEEMYQRAIAVAERPAEEKGTTSTSRCSSTTCGRRARILH